MFFIQNFLILQYFISKKGINFFILINKYILLYNAEKNMGALDDFLFFITFFILIIFYYFLGLFGIIFIFSKTLAITIYSINIFIFLTLTIPVCYFYFLGIVFPAFIRGAGISTNILIEFIFDLLSTIVVFCRFLIQNIRLIIILLAYFELMEFINLNYIFINFKNLFNTSLDLFISNTTLLSTLKFLIILITILILYTYYALHLLILGLMQIGIYVFITFGLFIFMYSCLSLIVKEKYFNK